jgi:WD40 repeat protein
MLNIIIATLNSHTLWERGHTAALTLARWHPLDKATFLTAAADSTIRLWTAEDTKKQKGVIPVKSKLPGGRTPITAAAYSNDGRLIVGGIFRVFVFYKKSL